MTYVAVPSPLVLSITNSLSGQFLVAKYMVIITSSYASFHNSKLVERGRWIQEKYLHHRDLCWVQFKHLVGSSTTMKRKHHGRRWNEQGSLGSAWCWCWWPGYGWLVKMHWAMHLRYMHFSALIVFFNKDEKRENLMSWPQRNTNSEYCRSVGIAFFKDSYKSSAVWPFISMVWWFWTLAAH